MFFKATFVIYTKDQKKAVQFYSEVLRMSPVLDVPGMTEFQLSESMKLGIMPAAGITRILAGKVDEPICNVTQLKCELYLYVDEPLSYYTRALSAGGTGISYLEMRNWGDCVAYCMDLDGNLLAFAEKGIEESTHI